MPTTNRNWKTGCAYAAAVMVVLQLVLFLVSWLITAASPESTVRSLLNSEGVRWFFGSFIDNVATPPLVWILVSAMALGALSQSRMIQTILHPRPRTYRQTFALRIVLFELLFFLVFIVLIAFVPHAALLSVTGHLFPSSFSNSLIPIIAFCVAVMAITYGILTATMRSAKEVFQALCDGLSRSTPLIVLYVIASELFFSLLYVFPFFRD